MYRVLFVFHFTVKLSKVFMQHMHPTDVHKNWFIKKLNMEHKLIFPGIMFSRQAQKKIMNLGKK